MIIENLRKITDDMYAAIRTLPENESEGESTQKTLRAIDYSLEYLFAHVQLLGDRDMDYLNNNSLEPLTPQQKEKFFALAEEAEQKANDLRIKISETLKTAYVKINIDKKNAGISYRALVKLDIKNITIDYLGGAGFVSGAIDNLAKTVFDYLKFLTNLPQEDPQKKMELRHHFKGALMFLEYFFE